MAVTTEPIVIKARTRAIVSFGPPTDLDGLKAGEYFQVTIDPTKQSPGGDYIRFDQRDVDAENEIHGWQRLAALTVCEVLHVETKESGESVSVQAIVKE